MLESAPNELEAARQQFECPIKNPNDQAEVDKAKALIYSAAGEFGFNANHTPWVIEQFTQGDQVIQYRLVATFSA